MTVDAEIVVRAHSHHDEPDGLAAQQLDREVIEKVLQHAGDRRAVHREPKTTAWDRSIMSTARGLRASRLDAPVGTHRRKRLTVKVEPAHDVVR